MKWCGENKDSLIISKEEREKISSQEAKLSASISKVKLVAVSNVLLNVLIENIARKFLHNILGYA